MTCLENQQLFDARLDHELDAAQLAAMDAHLASCADCRSQWESYALAWDLLARTPAVEPSHGFTDRTLRQLADRPRGALRYIAWLLGWRGVVISAATACLIVGIIIVVSYRPPHRPYRSNRMYSMVQQDDYLEDYDVIEHLHEFNQEKIQ